MKIVKKFFSEYLFLNLFIFGCISLLSAVFLNISIFDPFAEAFHDFSLTDLYYTKVKNRDTIYKGPVLLVNVEDKDRTQIAFLLQKIQEGQPKTVALDIIFKQRINGQDSLLKQQFQKHGNYVFSYIADFENDKTAVHTDSFFTKQQGGYVNMFGNNPEYATIRDYHPFYKSRAAFTSAIIQHYNDFLYKKLSARKNRKTEIHYSGNLNNFTYYNYDEVMDPQFDATAFKDKIVLLGYLGIPRVNAANRTDEDKLFTPLNSHLSGRSYPDMYGCVIHANILQMILQNDYIKVVPQWGVYLLSFLMLWLILPFMCRLFFKGDLWFNSAGTLIQLLGSLLIVFLSILIYRYLHVRFDPGLLTAGLVLMPTLINLYEAFLKFLRYKLNIRFRSAFFGKNDND